MGENAEEREGRIWLERGIASARGGQKADARQALFRALNYESQREMCWLWLAAVSEDAQQERVYLKKVLALNPNNRFARAGLAHLEAKIAQSGATAEPAGAGALGLLEQDSQAEDNVATSPSPSSPADPHPGAAPRNGPAVQVPQVTVLEQIPVPAEERPRSHRGPDRVESRPVRQAEEASGEDRPVAPPAKPSGPVSAPGNASDTELSGWTVESSPVPAIKSVETESPAEPSGWTRSIPKAAPAPRPRTARYEVNPVLVAPAQTKVTFSGALSEVFQSHETWTAMAATVSLAGLAVILIILAIMSVMGS